MTNASGSTSPGPRLRSSRYEALDLLRLFAVGMVILFHYAFRGAAGADHLTTLSLPALAPVAVYGYLGVKLFFVISGFVIALSARGRTATQFVIARASRIYPAFLFCMTVTFMFTLAFGGEIFHAGFATWFANATILLPAKSLQYAMDGAYWSIFAELTFYGWIALVIAAGLFDRNLVLVVVAWLLVSALNQLAVHSMLMERLLLTGQSGFFAAGIMLFVLHEEEHSAQNWLILALATVLGITQALDEIPYFADFMHAPLDARVLIALAIGCVALVGAATLVRRVPMPAAWVAAIGGLTYPLYLLHQNIGYMAFNRLAGLAEPPVLAAGVAVLMLAASWSTWRYVDRPGQKLMRDRLTGLVQSLRSVRA